MDFGLRANRVMEKGEEPLAKVYSPKVVHGKELVVVGLDGGSTQGRIIIADKKDYASDLEGELNNVRIIPSIHSQIATNEEIRPKSEELYDCMDSWITNSIPAPNSMFDKVRVVRGTKYIDANQGSARVNSSIQKIDTVAFYLNIIDTIAYGLITKYDVLKEEYDVYLGISLPPDNVKSGANREKFEKRLMGKFIWENKDLNVSITINIKGVSEQTEPEAAVKAYFAMIDEDIPEYALLIEGGGSTCGVEVLMNGRSVDAASQTFKYGGTQLQKTLGDIYNDAEGGNELSLIHLKRALETGVLKIGRSNKDMVPYIITAKNEIAKKLFFDITTKVFDQTSRDFDFLSMETVLFSGRLFNSGEFEPGDDGLTGYSLSEPLIKLFKQQNPSAEYKVIKNNLIPAGNFMEALRLFGGYLEEPEIQISENETQEE